MKSYFFIPATKSNKINKIVDLEVDEIIIDFEDSVIESKRKDLLNLILKTEKNLNYWFRVPIRSNDLDPLNLDFLSQLLQAGVKKIMLPKIKSQEEFDWVVEKTKSFDEIEFFLLIEHPRLLMELQQILTNKLYNEVIRGIGLGSHDLMNFISAEHKEEQLFFPRIQLLYLGKAYGIEVIDIASMNLSEQFDFENELTFGMEHGFDAKFIIHPKQLEWMHNFEQNKNSQIEWAQKVIEACPADHLGKEIEPFILDGNVIEKPHVEKAYNILKKYKHGK